MRDPNAAHSISNIKAHLDSVGVETAGIAERGRKRERSRDRRGEKEREAAEKMDEGADYGTMSESRIKRVKKAAEKERKRDESVARSHSRPRTLAEEGMKDPEAKRLAMKKVKQAQGGWAGGAGEGDNRKSVHLVKWCNTGKKRNGTHYQR
jgi:nucleolar GTP-binding protein